MATAASMDYVQKIFIAYLGRGASTEALEYWGNAIDADEEQGKADFFANIWGSDAAVALYAGMDTEAIITQIFQNAFERDPAAEGIAYWEGEIANGNVNSVSLAAAIVDSAGALDLVVYDYKTEAGNYYRTEMDDNGKDFSADQSLAAVQDVEGPASLQDSKDATDAIAGVTALVDSLTTADNDVMAMTADDDVITATDADYGRSATKLKIASTEDSDTLTVDATADFTFGTVTNVETINVDLEKVNGAAFQIDVGGVTGTGSTMHITTAADTSLGGAPISGETKVELIGDLSVDVTTTDVTAFDGRVSDKRRHHHYGRCESCSCHCHLCQWGERQRLCGSWQCECRCNSRLGRWRCRFPWRYRQWGSYCQRHRRRVIGAHR